MIKKVIFIDQRDKEILEVSDLKNFILPKQKENIIFDKKLYTVGPIEHNYDSKVITIFMCRQ